MKLVNKIKKIWKSLGSGLITGASDNDPSAIITYSTAGAKLGLGSIWILLYILPIMIVMQEMSARIGLSSSCGLAGNIKRHYSKKILIFISTLLITANTLNIGADIYGMTSAIEIFIPQKIHLLSWLTIILILILIIALPYKKIVKIFKWLSFCLFTYVLAGLIVIDNWVEILKNIFVPNITFTKEGILIMVAILGTTLSPYLAFWQASEEAEEKKIKYNYDNEAPKCEYRIVTKNELKKITIDTRIGMFFSNFISFFIISLTSSVFFNAGINNISTIKDAAEALKPLVGDFSYFLFSMGIISSGLLAIPILAGSSAYVMSEIFNWPGSLNHPFNKAREFYFVIIISTIFGIIMPYLGISAVKSLIWVAIIQGIIAPFLIATILHMANNPKIVGPNVNKKITNIIGYLTLIILILALILLFIANTSLF
jgi:NRAMP (natural resistance-associated macrophage protein)-like metal ion transporter